MIAQAQPVELDPSIAVDTVKSWGEGFIALAPAIGVAFIIFILFVIAARIVRKVTIAGFERSHRKNLGEVLGGFFRWVVLAWGIIIAATIVLPSLNPGDIVAGLGIGSVAIGFAFKDILQNWLAGVLLLMREPFKVGDVIEVNGYEGTVVDIETRATLIKTFDGQKVLMPNAQVFTNAVTVRNGYSARRSEYDVGIGYGDDLEAARDIIFDTISKIDGIESEPAPEVLPWGLDASWVTLRVRWWTDNINGSLLTNRVNVILSIKKALDEAGIDMPYETQVHLFHDQTEDTDGNREAQREGWPSANVGETTPRWKAEVKEKAALEPAKISSRSKSGSKKSD